MADLLDAFPYRDRFPVQRQLPEHGRARAEVLAELTELAAEEDATWAQGTCSGTIYHLSLIHI